MTPVRLHIVAAFVSLLMLVTLTAFIPISPETDPPANEPPPGDYRVMTYGPVISESIRKQWPENSLVRKGLAIRLDSAAAVLFDTDLVHLSAAVSGGWIDLSGTDYTSYRGTGTPVTEGRELFGSSEIAGWAHGESFYAPREEGLGPLPREWAHYRGHYRHGDRVILSYRVGSTDLLEMPAAVRRDGTLYIVRSLQIEPADEELRGLLFELRPGWEVLEETDRYLRVDNGERILTAALFGEETDARLRSGEDGRIELEIPPGSRPKLVRVLLFEEPAGTTGKPSLPAAAGDLPDPASLTGGGSVQWNETITLAGEKGEEDFAYTVDRLPVPFDNPWNSWMRISGLDFFEEGDSAAVSTWNGDVWIVSGIDHDLESVTWRRFATGLFYPMGIAVVDGTIHVTERSQITRLHDLNGNGEADFYENFNNDGVLYPMAHSLTLEVDSEGLFYFFKNGNRVPAGIPQHGALVRLSPDGDRREIRATGIRGANTLGIGPDDAILSADQQGNWVPVERVDLLKKDRFYGYRPHGGESLPIGEFEPPVAWIPYHINNSSGLITWAGDERWGPLANQWILGSYGRSRLLLLLTQKFDSEHWQGGVIDLPLESASGLMRGRVNPADGQLYTVGLKGWTTLGEEDGSFERIRYTGRDLHLPDRLHVHPDGIELRFTVPPDPESAIRTDNFRIERWEYRYTSDYGSAEYSLADPNREGRDPVALRSVRLQEDGRTLYLDIPDIESVMQMKISWNLRFKDGEHSEGTVYHTINWLSGTETDHRPAWQERLIRSAGELAAERDVEETDDERRDELSRVGEISFRNHCASCHLRGGVAPSMEESEWAKDSEGSLIRILLHGKRGERGVMAPFGWMDDDELAAITSYIRSRWHEGEPVGVEEIRRIRELYPDGHGLWSEETLRSREVRERR